MKPGQRWKFRTVLAVFSLAVFWFLGWNVHAAETKTYSKLLVGDDLKQFWLGKWYFGGGDQADPKNSGAWLQFDYPGNGPLPEPIKIAVKIGERLPIGRGYYVFVRNYYEGQMEVTVGDISREFKIPHHAATGWIPCGLFEPNAPFDQVVLRYFPTGLMKDSGAEQSTRQFVRGIFITTDGSKLVRGAGEIVDLLPEVRPASVKDNCLENASFETGLYGWGKNWGNAYVLGAEDLDSATAAHGRYSLKLSAERAAKHKGSCCLESKLYRLPPDATYTLSFFAKSDSPLSVTVEAYGLTEDGRGNVKVPGFGGNVSVGNEWKRHSVTGRFPALPGFLYSVRFLANIGPPAVVWLDAIQLEQGEAMSDFHIREKVQVGWVSRVAGNIYYDRDPCQAEVRLYNPKDQKEVVLKHVITDYWDREVARGEKNIVLAGKKNETLSLPLYSARRGIYRLVLSTMDSVSEMVYSVLPPNLHLNEFYEEGTLGCEAACGPYHLEVLKRANFNWVMSKAIARWVPNEPMKGKFTFDNESVQAAKAAKMMILLQPFPGLLYQVEGSWLKDFSKPRGGKPWEKKDEYLKHWGEYLFQLVSHHKNSVKYWEIDNEPNWEYSGAEYGEILRTAIKNIKKADSKAKILGFSGGGFSQKFYDETIAVAGMDRVDVVSVHFYGNEPRDPLLFAALLKKYGKPGWNTETGRSCPTFFTTLLDVEQFRLRNFKEEKNSSLHEQSAFTAKNYLMSLSVSGCERYFYYTTRFHNSSPSILSKPTLDLMEYDGSLRASGVALSIASHFLDGAKYHGPVADHEQIEMHLYRKGQGSVGFLWAKPGSAVKVNRPGDAGFVFYDLMGNPITDATLMVEKNPIYFTSVQSSEQAQGILKAMK